MDEELIQEFVAETVEGLGELDAQLIALEQNPNDAEIIGGVFRIAHTIKGTCGFLKLPRLEAVAHAAENVFGKFRDGELTPTADSVSLILRTLDQIKAIVVEIEKTGVEPEGDDSALIAELDATAAGEAAPAPATKPAAAPAAPAAPSERTEAAEEREPAAVAQNIRVNVEVLEDLMTMVSELVLTRNQLLQTLRSEADSRFTAPLHRLNQITAELQEGVMKTRMQPIGAAWSKLPRIVRDLAQDLGKTVELEMSGAETELDRQLLELIKDPLAHMVRNACDHGLETQEERRAAGKPATGRIGLDASQEGGHIVIRVSDDGRGLSVEKIRAKAIQKGWATEAELGAMSEREIFGFIMRPGFSTAETVTNISGRGVGMDVVRSNIEKIGGTIEATSSEGQGTTFVIKVPLTLAIVSALIVASGGERFALPQIGVRELVRASGASEHRIEEIDGAPVLRLRERLLPLANLGDVMTLDEDPATPDGDQYVVVCSSGPQVFGVIVDQVFDAEEIVVKPVAPILRDNPLFAGATILGDGGVVMILDVNGVAAKLKAGNDASPDAKQTQSKQRAARDEQVPLLIFKAGDGSPKATPLSLVARLEDVPRDAIERADGRLMTQYRGQIMPLVALGAPDGQETAPVIVFDDGARHAGLIVDEIIDIVQAPLEVELDAISEGVLGTLVVADKSTELIDAHYHIATVCPDWFLGGDRTAERRAILVVDDSPYFRHLLSPLLQRAGYAVTAAESAEKALGLKDAGRSFDLIVSDIEMPGMDGFEFAAAVRASEEWRDTPLVAVTTDPKPERAALGREAGFKECVGKTDRDALLTALSETLRREDAVA